MTERERLVRLIDQSPAMFCTGCNECPEARAKSVEMLADCLIASDVVEVVRCKDCIFCKASEVTNSFYCDWHREYYETFPNDFCSYGERREK